MRRCLPLPDVKTIFFSCKDLQNGNIKGLKENQQEREVLKISGSSVDLEAFCIQCGCALGKHSLKDNFVGFCASCLDSLSTGWPDWIAAKILSLMQLRLIALSQSGLSITVTTLHRKRKTPLSYTTFNCKLLWAAPLLNRIRVWLWEQEKLNL